MPLGEVIDAGNDKRLGVFQILRASWPVHEWHWETP
jgi:hypothetical protein